jgi:hypothetical protein
LCSVSDVGQSEVNAAELLILYHRPFEVESAIAKFKKYKLLGNDNIQAEVIQE